MSDPYENHDESRFHEDAYNLAHALQGVANAIHEAGQGGYDDTHVSRIQPDLDYYVTYCNQLMNAAAEHNSQYHDAFNTAAWKVGGAQHEVQEISNNVAEESKRMHGEQAIADLNQAIAALSR